MIRPAIVIAVLAVSTPAITENDTIAGAQMHREGIALFEPVAVAGSRRHAMREPTRHRPASQIAEANWQLAIRAGERLGIPAHVTSYHVAKESGGNQYARNPKSTATGLAQVVYRTHIAITGEQLSKQEHFRLATDPVRSANIMAAHIAACREQRPDWSPTQLHRLGYMAGLANCGSSLNRAAQHYARLASDMRFTPGNSAASYSMTGGQS